MPATKKALPGLPVKKAYPNMAEERGAIELKAAADYVGIDYNTARRQGVIRLWEEAGLIWTIPGTEIRRVLFEPLREWMYQTQEEARPGLLSKLISLKDLV